MCMNVFVPFLFSSSSFFFVMVGVVIVTHFYESMNAIIAITTDRFQSPLFCLFSCDTFLSNSIHISDLCFRRSMVK